MQRTEQVRTVFVLLLSLVGTAALFLPGAYDGSPWLVLTRCPSLFLPCWFALFTAPFFLVVPIVAWQMRKLLANQLSAIELTAAYVLSAAATLSVLAFTVIPLIEAKTSLSAWLLFASPPWIMATANFLLLWRNLKNRVGREATAESFLLGGYLPNAFFCVISFGLERKLQVGGYLIALVSLGYLAAIGLLSRRKPTGTPDPSAVS